mmetsp:Transcript_27276/g.82246  ORF Transcript_27276/g.82246 Transcript_27276/m.82246 type:complete len:110 (+) Transcript_27276:184-513(+)
MLCGVGVLGLRRRGRSVPSFRTPQRRGLFARRSGSAQRKWLRASPAADFFPAPKASAEEKRLLAAVLRVQRYVEARAGILARSGPDSRTSSNLRRADRARAARRVSKAP